MKFSDEVQKALDGRIGVVALESTIISHGLPRPTNLEVARQIEDCVREHGAVPATIALINGEVCVGLSDAELVEIANSSEVSKASVRDLPILAAQGRHAATTVAATSVIAARAGISIFATGGLGGVHKDARETWDESADLFTLAQTSMTVISAGVKSILDVPATLERLESLSVGIVGYQTKKFPGFYLKESGFEVEYSSDSPHEIAKMIKERKQLQLNTSMIVVNPIHNPVPTELHDQVLSEGLQRAKALGISGKKVTPFLLDYFHNNSQGESLRANIEIILSNAKLAAEIATQLAKLN